MPRLICFRKMPFFVFWCLMPLKPLGATFPCDLYSENVRSFVPYWNLGAWAINGRISAAGCCRGVPLTGGGQELPCARHKEFKPALKHPIVRQIFSQPGEHTES